MSDRQVLVTETYLEDIADGIREVDGTENEYMPSQMKAAIVATKKTLVSKTITENDTYDPADDNADGYSSVTVNVSGESPTLITKTITANDTYNAADDDADGYSTVTVAVPNTYAAGDEGKVVSNGDLVSQTQKSITANGTYDTTTNNSAVVAVPNTYAAGDEGKVVSNGDLVSQTARSSAITENGTYDTTNNNSVTVSFAIATTAEVLAYLGISAA